MSHHDMHTMYSYSSEGFKSMCTRTQPLPSGWSSRCHRPWGSYECFSVGPHRPPLEPDFVSFSSEFSASLGVFSNRQNLLVAKIKSIRSLPAAEILTPSFPFTQVMFPPHSSQLQIHLKYWSLQRWKVLQRNQLPHFCSLRKPSQHRPLRSVRLSRCTADRRRSRVFQIHFRS